MYKDIMEIFIYFVDGLEFVLLLVLIDNVNRFFFGNNLELLVNNFVRKNN